MPVRFTCAILIVLPLLTASWAYGQSGSKAEAARGGSKAAPCGKCHGTPGQPPLAGMPSLAGQQREFLALQIFLIREELRNVPEMKGVLEGITDADIADLAAYFAGQPALKLGGKPNAELQARGAARAKALGCGSCHMPDYAGQRQVPRLTGQREDYLVSTLKAYRENKRSGSDTSMNAVMYGVSDADIGALAHYLSNR